MQSAVPSSELIHQYCQNLVELMDICRSIEALLCRSALPAPCSRLHTPAGASASLDDLSARLEQYTADTRHLGSLLLARCRDLSPAPAQG